jgi:hypothetical protein
MQLGLSESARVTTKEESRYRINYPNSCPRKSRVIALDQRGTAALRRLAQEVDLPTAHLLSFVGATSVNDNLKILAVDAVLEDLTGRTSSLSEEIGEADIVVMVATAGGSADAAEIIGNACFVRSKMTTGLIVNAARVRSDELRRTLTAMRPFAAMLVISDGEEHIGEMLSALRA